MRKETRSIAFACALGSFIGSLAALEIDRRFAYGRYLWFFGALSGGIVAYATVRFRELLAGIGRAWNQVIDWRPDVLLWQAAGSSMLGVFAVLATANVLTWFVLDLSVPLSFWLLVWITIGGMFTCMQLTMTGIPSDEERSKYLRNMRDFWAKAFLWGNPGGLVIGFFVKGIPWMCVGTVRAAQYAPDALSDAALFLQIAFYNVHRHFRYVCFTDAVAGSVVGFFLGSPIIGAAVGAFVGILHYEFVSVRWLRIAAKK